MRPTAPHHRRPSGAGLSMARLHGAPECGSYLTHHDGEACSLLTRQLKLEAPEVVFNFRRLGRVFARGVREAVIQVSDQRIIQAGDELVLR